MNPNNNFNIDNVEQNNTALLNFIASKLVKIERVLDERFPSLPSPMTLLSASGNIYAYIYIYT